MNDVLTSPEILESIFCDLDQQTLLTSVLRVCSQCHQIISTSTLIQQHLFFRPDDKTKTRRLNPLLQSTFPPFFKLPPPNPKIFPSFAHQPPTLSRLPLAQKNLAAITRRGASWRRMLVQQPPIRELGVMVALTAYSADVLSFPDGLRMGTLYDLAFGYSRGKNPACWCMAWSPPLCKEDDMWAVDDTMAYWMKKSNLDLALFVIWFDSWGAGVLGLKDGRMAGGAPVKQLEGMRCEEFEKVEVNEKFYFLPR
ncbi:hypothetical protein QBC34DRAFT_412312 [Podospora aff. communis PSN243]|uniref:F-box domain-containing protein n=1 Tax=Podospora aff. communis PSN243 TaxID=3040156 RepID=A0AAV9GFN7_9PEZI|nr:hypothetical protein QBC34DRAFT_412312 [Podospora aff. communis PSN243]